MTKLLIGSSGSVAAIKLPELAELFINDGFEVKIVATTASAHFFKNTDLPDGVQIYYDKDEWEAWSKRGDPVLHIELGKWADKFLIAPLDANTLAKLAMGLCDNLLTCVARAWDFKKPFIFCPAMNTRMYEHPCTASHIEAIKRWGCVEVPVVEKTLMCGDIGLGAMADVHTIVKEVKKA